MPDSLHLVHFDCAPMVGIVLQMNRGELRIADAGRSLSITRSNRAKIQTSVRA